MGADPAVVRVEATVVEELPSLVYRLELVNKQKVLAHGAGAAERNWVRLLPGDRFMLCSDGLCKTVPEAEMAELLTRERPTDRLIAAALAHQGRDNVTAVAVEVLPTPQGGQV